MQTIRQDQSSQHETASTRAAAIGPVFVYRWRDVCVREDQYPLEDGEDRFHWVHADRTQEHTRRWVSDHSAIPEQARHALLEADTRPRVDAFGRGLLVILRAVELTPGSDPDVLISLRMWIDSKRLISLRSRKVLAPSQLEQRIENGHEITSPAQLLVELCSLVTVNLGDLIEDLAESIGALEEQSFEGRLVDQREELTAHQRRIVAFRRHMAPQAFALGKLREDAHALMQSHHHQLRELENRTHRIQEELHQLAERSILLKSDINDTTNRQVEQRMRLLTVLGAIFLPLSFLTGLLGINVGGMPGAEDHLAFWIVCGSMTVLLLGQLIWLRWKEWI